MKEFRFSIWVRDSQYKPPPDKPYYFQTTGYHFLKFIPRKGVPYVKHRRKMQLYERMAEHGVYG